MKHAVTYILISIVSLACSYETIEYFSKTVVDYHFTIIDDFQDEGKNTESENSNEKNEKADLSDDLYHSDKYANELISAHTEHKGLVSDRHNPFSPSDHSKEVYSPPEIL
ncbi:MAG: hypothetical protein HYU69_17150 [Bacteroidetes bacterium]|nr:hypothetical protein [Bacteroidota bacterium]